MANPRIVACPNCGAPVTFSAASPYRPFCSERCKMIDFGAWADERYRIPVVEPDDETGAPEGGPAPEPGRDA